MDPSGSNPLSPFGFTSWTSSWTSGNRSKAPSSFSTSPPYSPSWSPWATRSPVNLGAKGEICPGDSVSASSTPAYEPSTAKEDFRWSYDEVDSDSDSGTATPKAVPGARTPEYDAAASEVSYYSMTQLAEDNPHRRINAAEMRAQAMVIPNTVVRAREGFPHRFNNFEEVPLANPHPLIEHPLTPSGPYLAGSPSGPARIVVNEHDRSTPETMYHDPSKPIPPGSRFRPFSKGEHRGKDRSVPTGLEEEFGEMGI